MFLQLYHSETKIHLHQFVRLLHLLKMQMDQSLKASTLTLPEDSPKQFLTLVRLVNTNSNTSGQEL